MSDVQETLSERFQLRLKPSEVEMMKVRVTLAGCSVNTWVRRLIQRDEEGPTVKPDLAKLAAEVKAVAPKKTAITEPGIAEVRGFSAAVSKSREAKAAQPLNVPVVSPFASALSKVSTKVPERSMKPQFRSGGRL